MKSLYEQLGGTYHEENGYLIPDLRLPDEEEKTIGVWGQRHLEYLKQHQKGIYINLLTSGRLNAYLADIDKQAGDMFFRLVKEFAEKQGVKEQLKADSQFEWVQRFNNIRMCVMEIVNKEIIYA